MAVRTLLSARVLCGGVLFPCVNVHKWSFKTGVSNLILTLQNPNEYKKKLYRQCRKLKSHLKNPRQGAMTITVN